MKCRICNWHLHQGDYIYGVCHTCVQLLIGQYIAKQQEKSDINCPLNVHCNQASTVSMESEKYQYSNGALHDDYKYFGCNKHVCQTCKKGY